LRNNGIPLIAHPLEIVDEKDGVLNITTEPTIRMIDIGLAQKLHKDSTLFVDARAREYLAEGFIPGAIANDNIDSLVVMISALVGYDKMFVIYCSDDDCGSSEDLAYELQSFGFNDILVFKGGWKSWSDAGLKVMYHE
tara:strand:- start:70 stop:483 length:414 start_codon:yes stop_codon:yes gene_type:complete